MGHPSPFNDKTMVRIQDHLSPEEYEKVLDPFAGIGGIHVLRNKTFGVEIEPEWANEHRDTQVGNALDLPFDDDSFDAIATSPTFGNRMADHHNARDKSTRNTYKHRLGRDLHPENSGQMHWGDEYREFHEKAWAEATRVIKPGGRFVLHIKNHIRGGEEQRVSEWHLNTLMSLDWTLFSLEVIPTRGLQYGANREVRTNHEFLMVFDA